jgi:glyoxylase-like metal-dependent hydrolase (beta-lactamase superfamily II)
MTAHSAPPAELDYPFAEPPTHDSYIEVAPGVRWLRFPLPFALNHINLYLLDDGDGWVLVDTGIKSDISYDLWRKHFETTLEGRPITRVIGTHFHPDHIGCAEWLVEHFKAEFLTTRSEWLTATMLQSETSVSAMKFWGAYYRSAGLDDETLKAVATRGENYAERIGHMPRPFTRLVDGDAIQIGERTWHVVIGTGHSPELITLYSAEDHLFIASDQVLPGISPNISVQAPEPFGDPLTEFLDSCAKLTALDPVTYVLPMHGRPFYGLHERLEELVRHHGERLALTIEASRTPITVVELLPIMFKRKLDFQQMQFAIGEALAHVNHLVTLGDLQRIAEPGQPLRYQSLTN